MKKTMVWMLVAALGAAMVSSCVPLAAGAAAGYIARDQGYKVQSPLKKTDE